MKYITLLRLFKNNFDLDLMFYDVKEDKVIKFKREIYDIDQNSFDNFTPNQLKKFEYLSDCANNPKRYKPLPLPSNDIYVIAKRRFEQNSKDYQLVSKLINAGYEEKGIDMFLELLYSPSCSYMVANTIDNVYKEIIQLFILQNSLTMIEDFNPYSLPFTYLKKIYEIAPWRSLGENDVLKINIDDQTLFVSIIGHENFESLGFYVYTNKENYTSFVAQQENMMDPSLLYASLTNAYAFDYASLEERTSEEQIMANRSKVAFKKNAIPAMKRFQEGLWPSSEFEYKDICYISYILRYIYQALFQYDNQAKSIDLEVDEYLEFDILDNEVVKIKTWDNEIDIRPTYGIKAITEDLSNKLDSNKTYEVQIQPLDSYLNENHENYWVYTLIVLDKDTNKIITAEQCFYGLGQMAPFFQKFIHDFVKENGFAKNIYVTNFLVADILVNSISKDLNINFDAQSDALREIFNDLNEKLHDFEDEDDDEAILN